MDVQQFVFQIARVSHCENPIVNWCIALMEDDLFRKHSKCEYFNFLHPDVPGINPLFIYIFIVIHLKGDFLHFKKPYFYYWFVSGVKW